MIILRALSFIVNILRQKTGQIRIQVQTNTNALNVITLNESSLTPSLSPAGRGEGEGDPHVKVSNAFVLDFLS